MGGNRVAKRLDRFSGLDYLLMECDLVRQWVACRGELDHCPVFFEIQDRNKKPPIPFKFNPEWIKEASFCKLVHDHWTPFTIGNGVYAGVQFMENLRILKQAIITWVHDKSSRDELDLQHCQLFLD